MEHLGGRDVSRLSTDENAPLFRHQMTDSTFMSGIEVGRVNLLGTGFNQMKTLRDSEPLILTNQHNDVTILF